MKKLAAFLFTMIVILALVSAVYAEDNSTTVMMTIGDIYFFSVPETVSMTRSGGSGDIELNVTQLEEGHSISVSLTGQNNFNPDTYEFTLLSTDLQNSIHYKIKYNTAPITDGAFFATVSETGKQIIPLVFSPSSDLSSCNSGQYSDKLTYRVIVNGN